jgi:hypothetical protein
VLALAGVVTAVIGVVSLGGGNEVRTAIGPSGVTVSGTF